MGVYEWCGCEDWREDPRPLITIESTQYFFPCVSHNPHYRPSLVGALGEGLPLFRAALARVVGLAPAFAAEVDAFDAAHLHPPGAPPRHVVGMQIRVGHLVRAAHEEQVFYKCASALGAVAGAGWGEPARGGHPPAPGAPPSDVYYFLATDDKGVAERARARFGDKLLPYTGSLDPVVMDAWLLGRVDELVITWSKSTFGLVGGASGRGGVGPWAVVSGSKRSNECVKLVSTEPCYHGAWEGGEGGGVAAARVPPRHPPTPPPYSQV